MKVWVLTREINQYDQDGEYFEAVFLEKPNYAKLKPFGIPDDMMRWVMDGGGRKGVEDEWWYLREVNAL